MFVYNDTESTCRTDLSEKINWNKKDLRKENSKISTMDVFHLCKICCQNVNVARLVVKLALVVRPECAEQMMKPQSFVVVFGFYDMREPLGRQPGT